MRGNTEDILDLRADIDLKGTSLTSIFGVLDGSGGGGPHVACRIYEMAMSPVALVARSHVTSKNI